MNIELNRDGLCLNRNQVVKVRGGVGHSIVCDSGTVWVTQTGDPRDIVLAAGKSFTIDRNGLALVQAFEPSSISITRSAAQFRANMPAVLRRLAAAGAGLSRSAVGM